MALKVNPYLNFDGNAEQAFNFYKSVFGGEFTAGVMKMGDAPGMDKLSDDEKNRTMHVSLPLGNGQTLMASDTLPSMGHKLTQGNNIYLSVHPDTKEEADRLFNALAEGGNVEMPIADQFWGDYFGSLTDKFGTHWMINYHANA